LPTNDSQQWVSDIANYCEEFNIPCEYLCETLYEPKVVPMIRGKAFEFSVLVELLRILPAQEWHVSKERLNAQSGSHDIDVQIKHIPSNRSISAECKLAKNKGYRKIREDEIIKVKCMRSRTLGDAMIAQRAPVLGISVDLLKEHKDQYVPSDFDVVITSIGNAFYRTSEDGAFCWSPSDEEIDFLQRLFDKPNFASDELKPLAFKQMYCAKSSDIAVSSENTVECTRRNCPLRDSCGFIPNYPIITFNSSMQSINGWHSLEQAASLFHRFV